MTFCIDFHAADALRSLPRHATVLVPAGQPGYERLVASCELQGLRVYSAAPAQDGGISLTNIERSLGADAADRIDAVVVSGQDPALGPAIAAIIDRCWHAARIVLAESSQLTQIRQAA